MKIILSRKGFDSANGGIVSPILEDRNVLFLKRKENMAKYERLTTLILLLLPKHIGHLIFLRHGTLLLIDWGFKL